MSARTVDPRRYHEAVEPTMSPAAASDPVCLYLETTNRCNLLCTTCPRTYADLEPPADMSWELFTRIVDQVPNIARVVLHGVGEPMLVKDLPRMIRYLKDRGAYVLFNTNGTVLTARKGRELSDSGLDELRVSLDAADARTFLLIRGKDYFNRIVRNVRAFTEMQAREGLQRPKVSLWLTGLKETIAQLPAFVRIAHEIGVKEVYLQRLVFCEDSPVGMATPDQALFERLTQEDAHHLEAAERAGSRARHQLQCVRRHRARREPRTQGRRQSLVAVPTSLGGHVFHRQRTGAAVLHRALLAERLRELHAGRCHAAVPARDLERPRLPGFPHGPAVGRPAQVVRELRPALEPLASCPARPGRSTVRRSPSSSPASTRRRRSAPALRQCSRMAWAR